MYLNTFNYNRSNSYLVVAHNVHSWYMQATLNQTKG